MDADQFLPAIFDGEKPSRQNRRPKRSWKRPPKKALDMPPAAWHCGCTALETPTTSGNRSRQTSGIFMSIGFSMASSGRLYNTLQGKTDSGLVAVSKCSPPLTGMALSKNLLGIIMQTFIGVTRHTSLSLCVYRFVRHFAGPVLSYRLARFARSAA
jgi:hypothetical protein